MGNFRTLHIFCIALLLTSGCTTRISGTWEEPRTTNAPYDDVLVIALVSHQDMRLTLERELARNLATGGSKASPSMNLNDGMKNAPQTREQIIALVREKDVDALLLLRVADASVKLGKSQKEKDKYLFGGSDPTVAEAKQQEDDTWGTRDTTNESDKLPDTKISTELRAVLYDAADDGRIVYTIDMQTQYKEKGGDFISVIAGNTAIAISDELRNQELVR